jgi:hypothetical protein
VSNITLPRAVGLHFREVLICGKGHSPHRCHDCDYYLDEAALAALDAALAEPEKERAETVIPARSVAGSEKPASQRDESYRTTEPPAKPEPVAWMESPHGAIRANPLYRITAPQSVAWSIPLYTHPPAAAKPEPVHPGYIIGSHWLETAYSRIAAGEAEAEVLTEVLGARGWAKREPATVEQVIAAHGPSWGPSATADFFTGFRAAERFHGIRKEDKA